MTSSAPAFWSQPLKFLRYSSHKNPHIVLSFILGITGPLAAVTLYSTREKYLFPDAAPIPAAYPLPEKRNPDLKGFDD